MRRQYKYIFNERDIPSFDPYRADIGQCDILGKHLRHLGVKVRNSQMMSKKKAHHSPPETWASIHFFVRKGARVAEKQQVEVWRWTRVVGRFLPLLERRERELG